ncbi:hypothetical protein E4T50_08847 [Aureobasidium sp. EXF-12298]|nr:hypothetical protein E4T50_08847 [Aureobasidium sp. EXF-12298]KAI4758183.1 hypothetical protein E4T51_08773 [Aureobasidium sp. EXF-12344]KAI4775413.1 hypothetical protein E4T52_09629 [Aureobasidium sp. EXF-3400]
MRLTIFIFISTSLALLIPRCDNGAYASSSIDARDLDASPVATAAHKATEPKPKYTKRYKTTSTKITTTTPLATRAVTTDAETSEAAELSTSSCTPVSICVDAINSCGMRYGGCYDQNFCDGNTSPYPIPTCSTMMTVKREAAAPPTITPA